MKIFQPNYDVTFFLSSEAMTGIFRCDGVLINGWPDDMNVDKVVAAWDCPEIEAKWLETNRFLAMNPEYRRPIPTSAKKSNLNPSQIEV